MIALVIFVVSFLVAWKLSLQATFRGGGLLIIALALYGILIWSAAASTPDDIFAANYAPHDGGGAGFDVGPMHWVILGHVTGAAAVALTAYVTGGLLGRFALRFKKGEA